MAILVKKLYRNKPRWYIQENGLINGKFKREFLSLRGSSFPKYFDSKRDAKSALSRYALVNDPSKSDDISLKTARDAFLKKYELDVLKGDVAQGTFDIFSYYSQRLLNDLGHILLRDISTKIIQRYVEEKSFGGWSSRYIQMHLVELNKILKFSFWDKEWISNIPRLPKLKIEIPKSIEVNSPEQIGMLLEHSSQQTYKLINLIWQTGVRPKEARFAKLHQINFDYHEGEFWIPYLKVKNVENKGGERLITMSHEYAETLKSLIGNGRFDPIDKFEFLYIDGID
ncbi:MAG: hypothetical protein HRT90_10945, partial [Candidatus Margulisbacteria bacterium]|nr:hypothetical protein [Candidatus Margulisiibacteriota bacterium]